MDKTISFFVAYPPDHTFVGWSIYTKYKDDGMMNT